MDIFFEPLKGVPFSIEVGFFDTILEIKQKIQKYHDIPIPSQTLFFNGRSLKDDCSVADCELVDNSHVQLFVRSEDSSASQKNCDGRSQKKLKLSVLSKCGRRKIPVEMNASDNVGELKKVLERLHERLHFDLPPEGYFFIFKQNVMEDEQSFRWHEVEQGDVIEIFNGCVSGG